MLHFLAIKIPGDQQVYNLDFWPQSILGIELYRIYCLTDATTTKDFKGGEEPTVRPIYLDAQSTTPLVSKHLLKDSEFV